MMTYQSTMEIPDLSYARTDFAWMIEKIQEVAAIGLISRDNNGLPISIRIMFDLEDGEDAWDLYERVHTLQDEIHGYLGVRLEIPRPTLVTP